MTKSTYLLYVSAGSIPAASTKTKVRKYAKISYVRTKRVMYRVMFSHDIVRFSHHFVMKPDTKPDTKEKKSGQGFCAPVRNFYAFSISLINCWNRLRVRSSGASCIKSRSSSIISAIASSREYPPRFSRLNLPRESLR